MARKQKQIVLDFHDITGNRLIFDTDHIPPAESIMSLNNSPDLKTELLKRRENLLATSQNIKFNGRATSPEELAERLLC